MHQPPPSGYQPSGSLGEDGGTSAFDFSDMTIRKAFIRKPPPSGYQSSGSLGEDGGISAFDFSDMTIRKAFIRKVYSILMCQLLVTMGFISLFSVYISRTHHSLGVGAAPAYVMMAVGITAAVCLALTLFAFQTKWDFTMMGGFLVCAAVVLLIFGLITISIPVYGTMPLVYACSGALLFSLFLVYDTQLILGGKHQYSVSPEEYIFAAFNLYIDIIKIFMYILRIIGLSRS